jgi:predicted acylesterase/phospholipase RssA
VDGTSGGIFGTAMAASGISPREAGERWRRLKLRGFLGAIPTSGKGLGLKLGNGAQGIRKAIFPALGIDAARIRSNDNFDATFNVCNFSKKRVESIPHTAITTDHLIAGMSLPMFMPAIQIGENWYTDSVWIKDCNMLEALRRGAEEIWLVWCIGNTPAYRKGYFNEYVCMIEISANAGVQRELERIAEANAAREKACQPAIRVHIIKPEFPLPLDPDFFFKKIDADTLISLGYADAQRAIAEGQPYDFSNLAAATLMREAPATLHFRQQFRGRTQWQGRAQNIALRLGIFCYETTEGTVLRCAGTVEAEDGVSLCGYDTELRKTGKGSLEASWSTGSGNSKQRISIVLRMSGLWDMLLGLDNQQAAVIITDSSGHSSASAFSQPAAKRISNAMHLSVISALNARKRWKAKLRLLRSLLQ